MSQQGEGKGRQQGEGKPRPYISTYHSKIDRALVNSYYSIFRPSLLTRHLQNSHF